MSLTPLPILLPNNISIRPDAIKLLMPCGAQPGIPTGPFADTDMDRVMVMLWSGEIISLPCADNAGANALAVRLHGEVRAAMQSIHEFAHNVQAADPLREEVKLLRGQLKSFMSASGKTVGSSYDLKTVMELFQRECKSRLPPGSKIDLDFGFALLKSILLALDEEALAQPR